MKTTATCQCCHTEHPTSQMIQTSLPKRGGAPAYYCQECNRNRWYHTSNNEKQGKDKASKVETGIENETAYTSNNARNQLFAYGMIPTSDSSLTGARTCEYVTGIMQGLNIASKLALTIEKLQNSGDLIINDSCGTHFHVSVDSMKDKNGCQTYMGYIRRFYHSLFVPLSKAMENDREKTIRVFGRYFQSHYAHSVNEYSNPNDRYNFINVTNDSNIEFRLNKFQSAKQYQNLMKMEVEMVQIIVTNFCEHFNDIMIDRRRYASQTEYRKHKAQVTANKLVKCYEKYSANI